MEARRRYLERREVELTSRGVATDYVHECQDYDAKDPLTKAACDGRLRSAAQRTVAQQILDGRNEILSRDAIEQTPMI